MRVVATIDKAIELINNGEVEEGLDTLRLARDRGLKQEGEIHGMMYPHPVPDINIYVDGKVVSHGSEDSKDSQG